MNQTFNFQSSIKDVQNRLLSQNIRQISNIEMLNSEEAIRNVIQSYTDRFQSLGGMLVDVSQFVAKSKDIIKVSSFNDLFESIYVDLAALYGDLDLVDQVLSLNLQRNKNYFLNIKKRIRDLWNKLSLTRSYIYDSNPTYESYYESFFTDINSKEVKNVLIDKKNGFMYLNPVKTTVNNKSHLIKNIICTSYPVKSDNGGVYYTTSELNTFEDNYKNGSRDMMENGLWKEEIISEDVPLMILNIGTNDIPIQRIYRGIVSLVDIEYVYGIEFNRIDFDLFGDKPTTIDAILYKEYESDNWKVLNFKDDDPLSTHDDQYAVKKYSVRGTNFDILTFYNVEKVRAKFLRIVFNQSNYEFMNSDNNKSVRTVQDKIQKDLEERRYELVHFNSNLEDIVAAPVNDENTSLYNNLITIIESTENIEEILTEIQKVLLPQVNIVNYDFNHTVKFEVGAWSIEPKLEKYTNVIGSFDSVPYKIKDRALISSSIITAQTQPDESTCNWYIGYEGKNIPIVENNTNIRKEPLYSVDMTTKHYNFWDWGYGTFALLDFPLDPKLSDTIGIYANGVFSDQISTRICFLNSRLLFFPELKDSYSQDYVLRYSCAMHDTVNLYVLARKSSKYVWNNNISLGIISTRKEVLQAFIQDVWTPYGYRSSQKRYLSEDYVVVSAMATIQEAKDWFGENFNNCLFVAEEIRYFIFSNVLEKYSNILSYGETKLQVDTSDVNSYLGGSSMGSSNLELLSTMYNIAPIPYFREL